MLRERAWQIAFVLIAVAALAAGAALQSPLRAERDRLNLDLVTADPNVPKDPKVVLLQIAPGGLRAPFQTYLWIHSQELKQQNKFYDAKQQRDLICDLMPHFPGVWSYHAWDMAWNISVATHTPQERWMWVTNGIKLLRDRGLYYNPNDMILYKELAWIFYQKMGAYLDDMHLVYKQRWAGLMHHVLGAPPVGSTEETIEAFRVIAEAPTSLPKLRTDPPAAALLDELAALGVGTDDRFLDYYNRFSGDVLVGGFTWLTGVPVSQREQAIAALMRDPKHAAGRAKVLAFVRRKVLAEQYRMDADWMLQVMQRFGPLDWRNVNAHALYWSSLGLHRVEHLELTYIHALNTERVSEGALKSLAFTGTLYLTPNPKDPENPYIDWGPDWRFIEPTDQEYIRAGAMLTGDPNDLSDGSKNTLRDGHINFLTNVVLELYFAGREEMADHYYKEIHRLLRPAGADYTLPLYDFVRSKMGRDTPFAELARAIWVSTLVNAYRALAGGNPAAYVENMNVARKAYEIHRKEMEGNPRYSPTPFEEQEANVLQAVLSQAESLPLRLPLLSRVRLYNALQPQKQLEVYPHVAEILKAQCRQEQIDFDKAFPAPPGYKPSTQPSPESPAGGAGTSERDGWGPAAMKGGEDRGSNPDTSGLETSTKRPNGTSLTGRLGTPTAG